MNAADIRHLVIAAIVAALAAIVPYVVNAYWLSIALTAMMYIALATSWALFSGPTHYISLASGAFFGDAWRWWVLPAGLMIAVTVLSLVLIGFTAEDILEPGLRG